MRMRDERKKGEFEEERKKTRKGMKVLILELQGASISQKVVVNGKLMEGYPTC